ncbi:MAG: ABC transporter ATP-binding protein, partial [Clostridium sp.]|uniref:ABC transporter ATP-binding protein n=1 Tax=Clostridium sp. TaxID=1506 RepID=UPI003EE68F8E
MAYVVEMLNIRKEFSGIVANDNITLTLKKGEVHALLGENGAGKSTLMSVLFGLYQPDRGQIKIDGKEVKITGPNKANEYGIGMVHQHFKLVENFTVTENIILGLEPKKFGFIVDKESAVKKIKELSEKYNLNIDPHAKIEDISVGMQQRVEILKMLYRNANVLILDEPTAVLTPQEIKELMNIIRDLIKEGKSVIIITHKLKEIKEIANRCTVIRRGKYIGTVDVKDTTEADMAKMMVGREVSFKVEKKDANPKEIVLKVNNLSVNRKKGVLGLKDFSLEVRGGEILGLAGVEGNGQVELVEAITGMKNIVSGNIEFLGNNIETLSIRERIDKGIAYIPEDRHKRGLVLDYSLENNMVLKSYKNKPFS